MTPSRPLRSAASAAAACASVRKVRGLGAVIARFTGLIDEATDLDPAAVESADMVSRGMVVELAMLDSPEFAGGDEVVVAHYVDLEPALGIRRLQAADACAGLCEHPRSCAAANQLRRFDFESIGRNGAVHHGPHRCRTLDRTTDSAGRSRHYPGSRRMSCCHRVHHLGPGGARLDRSRCSNRYCKWAPIHLRCPDP